MKKILSFDISSSTIGWALLSLENKEVNLISFGNIKPPKSKFSISKRLSETYKQIEKLIKKLSPDEIAVEDYAKRFSKGRSTATVIIVLSVFNETVCLACFNELNKDVSRYPVISIRSVLSNIFQKKIVAKEDVMPSILENSKIYKTRNGRTGKIKTECFDEADAIAVGLTHIYKTEGNIVKWNL